MFRKIDYGTDKKLEPIRVIRVKPENKKYHEWDVIIGKSILNINEKNEEEGKSILELMKNINKS